MAASLSMDLRERIVSAYEAGDVSYRDVARRFGVSRSTVGKLVHQFRTEKSLKPHTYRCGRRRSIRGQAEEDLENHVRTHPDATLQERRDALGLDCSVKTVWCAVKRLKARFKKSLSGRRNRTAKMLPCSDRSGLRASRV